MRASCSPGARPSGLLTGMPARNWPFRPATRTMKNSSRLLAEMDRNLTRSSSGWASLLASSKTRRLNWSQDSSRLMNRSGLAESSSARSGADPAGGHGSGLISSFLAITWLRSAMVGPAWVESNSPEDNARVTAPVKTDGKFRRPRSWLTDACAAAPPHPVPIPAPVLPQMSGPFGYQICNKRFIHHDLAIREKLHKNGAQKAVVRCINRCLGQGSQPRSQIGNPERPSGWRRSRRKQREAAAFAREIQEMKKRALVEKTGCHVLDHNRTGCQCRWHPPLFQRVRGNEPCSRRVRPDCSEVAFPRTFGADEHYHAIGPIRPRFDQP